MILSLWKDFWEVVLDIVEAAVKILKGGKMNQPDFITEMLNELAEKEAKMQLAHADLVLKEISDLTNQIEKILAQADGERKIIIEWALQKSDKLKNKGKIPNLKDIKVLVNGRTGKSNQQVERIQRFWEKYFEIADAQLLAYGYDVGDDITQYLKSYSSVK